MLRYWNNSTMIAGMVVYVRGGPHPCIVREHMEYQLVGVIFWEEEAWTWF